MNTKTILGISLAAAFAVSMIFALNVIASGSHLDIVKSNYKVLGNGDGKLQIKVAGDIPTDGTAGAFGYGVITGLDVIGYDKELQENILAPDNVLALTTHMCAADSPLQGPDGDCDAPVGVLSQLTDNVVLNEEHDGAEFYVHILDLMPATSDCSAVYGSNGLEVDLTRTLEGTPFGTADTDFQDNNLLAGTGITGPGDYDIKVKNNKITVKKFPSTDLAGTEAVGIVAFGIHGLANDSRPNIDNKSLFN